MQHSSLGAHVTSVNVSAVHSFSKDPALEARFLAGLGVEGDAHCGTTVRHRFDRRRDPYRPNLRQVHSIDTSCSTSWPGTAAGCTATVLRLGDEAAIQLTGLRTPCTLVDSLQPGPMRRMWGLDEAGRRTRRAGVMAAVTRTGTVRPGDPLTVVLPGGPLAPLPPV